MTPEQEPDEKPAPPNGDEGTDVSSEGAVEGGPDNAVAGSSGPVEGASGMATLSDVDDSSPESRRALAPGALLTTLSLLMFVGGALVTLMMVARSFQLHGTALIIYVVLACALVLGLAGSLMLRTLGDKWWIGAVMGGCFGAFSALLIYIQTRHYDWWR